VAFFVHFMNRKNPIPELLMPAGDLDKAYTAFRYGADAIYCGVPMFSLRTRENIFTESGLREIVQYAHKNGKKVYVTTNAFPHQYLIPLYEKHFRLLEEIKPDGIIFADLGVLSLANEFAPSIPKHLSVQTSTVNAPAIKLWKSLGVERIILAREMAIREVEQIHKLVPDMELEYFVHGAVCMAYSGRCLLSNFTGGRDANRGACNHTCRWNYRVYDEEGRQVDVSDHEIKQKTEARENKAGCGTGKCRDGGEKSTMESARSIRDFENFKYVEEEERKGSMIPMEEDFHGTHIMSSKDMCMIEHLESIWQSGVCSLKVEGRNKTAYYCATIARAYRRALDDLAAGKPFDQGLWEEIHATANRGFFPGFLHGKPREGSMQYEANRSVSKKEFCARVIDWKEGRVQIQVKNKIESGVELEFVMPDPSDDFLILAQDLCFGEESVSTLHGGNDNKIASLRCDIAPELGARLSGVFVRQKTQNISQMESGGFE
jgi:U32 family peptidase